MKKIATLLIVVFLFSVSLSACNSSPAETDSSDSLPKLSNSDAIISTEPNTPSATESNATDTSKPKKLIPTDPEDVEEILEKIGIEDINIATDGSFLGYGYMGNLECVVEGTLPGPNEEVIFFYCADTATANSIESYFSIEIKSTGEDYYAAKKENKIVFFGPAEVWEDFIDSVSENS